MAEMTKSQKECQLNRKFISNNNNNKNEQSNNRINIISAHNRDYHVIKSSNIEESSVQLERKNG